LVTLVVLGTTGAKASECLADADALAFDSLVLSGDVEAAVQMLTAVRARRFQQVELIPAVDDCDDLLARLEEVQAYVDQIAAQPVAYADDLVRRLALEEPGYRNESAGAEAAAAYTEFSRLAQLGENLQAVKWYRIARFFRTTFIARAIEEIDTNYKLAKQHYRDARYQDASDVIRNTVVPSSKNKRLVTLSENLDYLDSEVEQKLFEQERFERNWGSTEPVKNRITIAAGASLVFRPKLEQTRLILRNQNVIVDISLQKIPSDWTGSGSLECILSLTRAVQVGLGFGIGSYNITTPEVVEPVYFSIDLRQYSMVLLGRYYCRSLVGLRPFVTLGVGATRFERKATDVTMLLKYTDDSQTYSIEHFDLEGRSFTSTTVVAEYGMEYSPGAGRGIVTAPTVSLSYNFKGDRFVRQTNLTVSFRIGYKL
jgi:hypothetical protein